MDFEVAILYFFRVLGPRPPSFTKTNKNVRYSLRHWRQPTTKVKAAAYRPEKFPNTEVGTNVKKKTPSAKAIREITRKQKTSSKNCRAAKLRLVCSI